MSTTLSSGAPYASSPTPSSSHPCGKSPGTFCRSAPLTRSSAWPPSCCSWRRECLGPILQHFSQRVRPVGHDHVDPEVEQTAHLVRLVYGPRVHPHAACMRRSDEARGHYLYASVPEGDLKRVVGRAHETLQAEPARKVENPNLPPRGPRKGVAA